MSDEHIKAAWNQTADLIPHIMFSATPDGRIDFANNYWHEYTGLPKDTPESWTTAIHPHDFDRCIAEWNNCIAAGEVYKIEVRFRSSRGNYRWFLDRAFPVRSAGQIIRWVGICTDIDEQKKRETNTENDRRLWRMVCNSVTDLVWSATTEGVGDFINKRWCEYVGAATEEVLGDKWMKFVHPDDVGALRHKWLEETIKAGKSHFEAEYRLRRHDGEYRWFLSRGNFANDGEKNLWIGTCTDIHDQKVKEECLRQDSVKKDVFLAMLAHELRNPLAVVVNGIHLLHQQASVFENEQTGHRLLEIEEMIGRQTKHLTRLVDDLLDIGQIARGKIVLRRDVVDINKVIENGIEQSQKFIGEKNHRLILNLSSDQIRVSADSTRLTQAISNLLNNAAKYTLPGGEIVISSRVENGQAFVSVKDNGIGIDADQLEYIFELFAQVDHSLDRSQGGLGIGLTLVRQIMWLHGGSISAHSDGLGDGSEFTISMPLTSDDLTKERHCVSGHVNSRSILIVDDIVDATKTMAALLRKQGHTVWTANTGETALAIIEQVKPECVLLDIGLPGMDGYEVARRIRAKHQNIVLVAFTGYGQEEDRRRSEEVGFNYHLVKPVNFEDLAEILARG